MRRVSLGSTSARGYTSPMSEDRVQVEPARHVRVELAGKIVADTSHGYIVHEVGLPDRYYVPRSDVHAKLADGHGAGTCPWKGKWKHLDVDVEGVNLGNGAWTYYETTPVCGPLRDHVAFYENKFQIRVER